MTRANENLNNPPRIGGNMTDPREGEDITYTANLKARNTQSTGHTQAGSEKNEN